MGFWLDFNLAKVFPKGQQKLWYLMKDEKGNRHLGLAPVKKGEAKFKWRNSEYELVGTPEYEASLGIRFFEYVYDCPYPINIDTNAEHLVSFRERAQTAQIAKANEREIAFAKAKALFKKDDKSGQMLLWLVLLGIGGCLIMLWNIMQKLPK